MYDVPPAARALAFKVLHPESNEDLVAHELVTEAEGVFLRLEERLSRLFGRSGYSALLGRALYLARRDHQILDQLVVDKDAPCGFQGLNEFGVTFVDDPDAVAAALSSVLGNVIWLLVVFIGVELSVRLIGELWPDLAESARGLSEQEG